MPLRAHLVIATAAASMLAAAAASAQPKRGCEGATVWTSDALLHLAFVRAGAIEPRKSACDDAVERYTGKAFGFFEAVDRWGQPVGVVRRSQTSRGDSFQLLKGSRGAGIFVRTNGVPWAVRSAAATPSVDDRLAVGRWLGGVKPRSLTFFRVWKEGAPRQHALVVTRDGVKVVYLDEQARVRVAYDKSSRPSSWPLYRLAAIVDINGDDVPEVILHVNDYEDGRGYEVLLGSSNNGRRYAEISDNEDTGP